MRDEAAGEVILELVDMEEEVTTEGSIKEEEEEEGDGTELESLRLKG